MRNENTRVSHLQWVDGVQNFPSNFDLDPTTLTLIFYLYDPDLDPRDRDLEYFLPLAYDLWTRPIFQPAEHKQTDRRCRTQMDPTKNITSSANSIYRGWKVKDTCITLVLVFIFSGKLECSLIYGIAQGTCHLIWSDDAHRTQRGWVWRIISKAELFTIYTFLLYFLQVNIYRSHTIYFFYIFYVFYNIYRSFQWWANPNPDLDLITDLATFAKSGGFGFGLDPILPIYFVYIFFLCIYFFYIFMFNIFCNICREYTIYIFYIFYISYDIYRSYTISFIYIFYFFYIIYRSFIITESVNDLLKI